MARWFRLAALLIVAGAVGAGAQSGPVPDADPRLERLVASVSVEHLRQMLTTLAGFGTRNTLSSTASSTRGIGAARQWIFDELRRSSSKLQVSFDSHQIAPQGRITREVEVRNVMAVLPGRSSRRIYVTGHYDSLNIPDQTRGVSRPTPLPAGFDAMAQPGQDFDVDAAGANDDGSGTVLTIELARRFAESGIDFDATLVFICWAGEEQGLIGSTAHAQLLAEQNVAVDAMFDNDIVGNSRGGSGVLDSATIRVYSEGPEDSMSRSLARYVQRLSALYVPSHRVRLLARQDRFGRGSDHQAFNGYGFPAVVFREANENYEKQHSAHDTLEGVDFQYLAQNARVNAAAMASLAIAPPSPGVLSDRGQPLLGRGPSGYDAALRWIASPGAIAYRIYWRDAWAVDWQHQQVVGNVTQFVLQNLSIDNVVLGVAAIGPTGHESLVSAYVTPPRRVQTVKLIGQN
jgi:Zn-dependent M28 family amino/carboxypeptidase